MPIISRQGISGQAACVAAETLLAASPMTSQRSNGRILMQSTRKESRLIEIFDEAQRISRREQHIEEKRCIAFGQFSHKRLRRLSKLPGGE